MSPYLIEELFEQLKRVLSKPLMITDGHGQPYAGANDVSGVKSVTYSEHPTREKNSVTIDKHPELVAVPLYSEERLLGLVVAEVSPEDIQTIQIITSMSDLIIQQFLTQHRPRPDAVDLLLTRLVYRPQTLEEGELEQQMAALGYRLDVQRCAVLFELTGFWDNYLQTIGSGDAYSRSGQSAGAQSLGEKQNLIAAKKRDISQSLISFFSKNQDNVVGYIGNDRFLVLKDLSSTDFQRFSSLFIAHYGEVTDILKNIYIKEVTAGLGSPSFSADDAPASVEEALQSLEVGKKLRGANTAYRSDVLGVLPLILSTHTTQKRDQAGRILVNLTDDELQETLAAFLHHDLNLTQTAEALKVHRNTVIYRLDKITELVGKDPRRFNDAVELYLALQLQKIFT